MNWKEFLKPGKRKFVISLVLFGSISFAFVGANFLLACLAMMECFDACDGTEPMNRISNFLFGFFYPTLYKSVDRLALVSSLVIAIGVFYVLSCLVVRIFDKPKKEQGPALPLD